MKKLLNVLVFAILTFPVFGQNSQNNNVSKHVIDSIRAKYLDSLAFKNFSLRQAGVATEVFGEGQIKSDLKGAPFYEGTYQIVRTNAFFNVPILRLRKNTISAGFAVSHQSMSIKQVTSYDPSFPLEDIQTHNTLLDTSIKFLRVDSLFKKPVVYSVTSTALVEPSTGVTQIAASGLVSIALKKTPNTTFSVGLIGLIDPSAPLPIIPFISYFHRFKSNVELSFECF